MLSASVSGSIGSQKLLCLFLEVLPAAAAAGSASLSHQRCGTSWTGQLSIAATGPSLREASCLEFGPAASYAVTAAEVGSIGASLRWPQDLSAVLSTSDAFARFDGHCTEGYGAARAGNEDAH